MHLAHAVLCDNDERITAHFFDCNFERSLYQGESSRYWVIFTPQAEGGARGFVTAYHMETNLGLRRHRLILLIGHGG